MMAPMIMNSQLTIFYLSASRLHAWFVSSFVCHLDAVQVVCFTRTWKIQVAIHEVELKKTALTEVVGTRTFGAMLRSFAAQGISQVGNFVSVGCCTCRGPEASNDRRQPGAPAETIYKTAKTMMR
jgi:hypothetical protein